jgi:asparaginyl-tRNA synthetase
MFSPKKPFWITHFDRDRVPFYQKPNPNNKSNVLNADLIFPPLIENSFGGEIVGCGERQDTASEIIESIRRQNVDSMPYDWYINLRNFDNYATTSGFGMGVERYLTWLLCLNDIKNVIPYPRLKNVITHP